MREMGEFEIREHKDIVKLILENRTKFDKIFLVGHEWAYSEYDQTCIFYDSVIMMKELCNIWDTCKESKRIIVKGSRGIALEKLFE
jgi:UDP-N-acetylmuramyl pentapeptide synthase